MRESFPVIIAPNSRAFSSSRDSDSMVRAPWCNVGGKEREKIAKYQSLGAELKKMWGLDYIVVPVVVGGLGTITKHFNDHLAKLPGYPKGFMCQKIAMLGSKRILSDVLNRA